MTASRDAEIWAGLERRLAGVEAFVHPAPPWPGAAPEALARRGPAMGPTLLGRERQMPARRRWLQPGLVAAGLVVALVGIALLAGPAARFGTEPSPSPTASPSTFTPEPTLPPDTTIFRSDAFGYSIEYPFAWSAIDEPFGPGSPGVVEIATASNAVFVSVGTATQGPPDLCSGCGRLSSTDLEALGDEVADTLIRTRTGGPYSRRNVAISASAATLDGRPAREVKVVFPDEHGTTAYALVAADGPRRVVISIVPDFPTEPSESVFRAIVDGFRFEP